MNFENPTPRDKLKVCAIMSERSLDVCYEFREKFRQEAPECLYPLKGMITTYKAQLGVIYFAFPKLRQEVREEKEKLERRLAREKCLL